MRLFCILIFYTTTAFGQLDSSLIQSYLHQGLTLDSCHYTPLYDELCTWLETPYKYGGNSRYGADCSGFTKCLYGAVYGLALEGSAQSLNQQTDSLSIEQLTEGDLVFFNINEKGVSHVGVYLANGYFTHASSSRGVIINHLAEKYYKQRFYSGGRVKMPTTSRKNELIFEHQLTEQTKVHP